MNIFPEDLGTGNYQQVLRYRAQIRGFWQIAEPEQTTVSLSSIHHRWIKGSDIDEQTAKYAWPAFALCHLWQHIIVTLVVLIFIAICVGVGYFWFQPRHLVSEVIGGTGIIVFVAGLILGNFVLPRGIFGSLHGNVSQREVARLRQKATDTLKQNYFEIVWEVTKLPQQIDETLTHNIRRSLCALGNAVDDVLPEENQVFSSDKPRKPNTREGAVALDVDWSKPKNKSYSKLTHQSLGADAVELKKQAEKLLSEAASENDPVVAASIKRQSVSLMHQASTIDQITLLNRRNKALRGEILQQMNSLRTRLNASYLMRGQAVSGFADMFDQITHLASEASQVAAAQEELTSVLSSQ